jgi:hypothetical protein
MVVWKGDVQREHGEKAYNLDQVGLEVPNFFVITSEEVKDIFGTRDPERILNSSIEIDEIQEAHKEVGMSSEVRNASSKARNLVGGQRNKSRVSIRVSEDADSDYELDVGSSDLEESLKKVVSSYFQENNVREFPSIVIQKMIEPEYTGALIKGDKNYIEVVEGLGVPLEEGRTEPSRYLIDRGVESEIPDEQLKVTRNPMTGYYRDKTVEGLERPFTESEVKKLSEKASHSIKFVYKRGSFFVIDAFSTEKTFNNIDELKVSSGNIEGVIGRDIEFSRETLPPTQYEEGLVAKKGGYISDDAQKAREAGKPAIFSSNREEGERIGENSEIDKRKTDNLGGEKSISRPATEIVRIESLETGFSSDNAYIESYSEVFAFEDDEAVFDTRRVKDQGLEKALDYLEGDITVVVDEVDEDILEKVVENDFRLTVPSTMIEEFKVSVERLERKFILDRLRDISR